MQKQRKKFPCCRNDTFFIFISRGEHLPRGGATRNILLYLLYIALQAHSLQGVFYVSQSRQSPVRPGHKTVKPAGHQSRPVRSGREPSCQRQPGFQHTKNAARKVSIKSMQKIFIFLIILHIKYEDKKTSRRQNIKK